VFPPPFGSFQVVAHTHPNLFPQTQTRSCSFLAAAPFTPIHPRLKQLPAARLSTAALAQIYGQKAPFLGPVATAAAFVGNSGNGAATVTVSFQPLNQGPLANALVFHQSQCPTSEGIPANLCVGYSITGSDAIVYAATAKINRDGVSLTLSAVLPQGVKVSSVQYAYGVWPVVTLYSEAGIPALPFNLSVTSA
jgi:sialate O-acetylesterase